MISVIIPLYNKVATVEAALRCVLAQSHQDFEIVVVDDGSTDGSADVVSRVEDSRIRLIRQANAGVSAARNRGIAEARGEYVAFLDADDEWKPDYLAVQHRMTVLYPQCDVFATNYEFRDASGRVRPTLLNRLAIDGDSGVMDNYFEVASCSHPPLWTSAVMVRRSAIESVGGFPVGIKSGEDLLTWARLACRYMIAFSTNVLAVFCETPSEDSTKSKSQQRAGGEDYVLKRLLDLYLAATGNLKNQLKEYVLRWYKIYCVLLIETNNCHRILRVAISAIRFGGKISIFIPLMCFGFLPTDFSRKLFLKLRR